MMQRTVAAILFLQITAVPISATEDPRKTDPQPNFSRSRLVRRLVGTPALMRVGVKAAYSHVANNPHEWGRGVAGLGKRAGSAMGGHVVRGSVEYTVGTFLHEQLGYQRSEKQGFKPRMTHALLATVITRKTTTGAKTPAIGRLSGTFASALVSRLWQPVRLRTVSSGFSSAGISLGVDAGTNVVREFWPEIRHPRRRHPRQIDPVVTPSPLPVQ